MPRLRERGDQREAASGRFGSCRPLAPAAAPDASSILRGPTRKGGAARTDYSDCRRRRSRAAD
jgi:hypothetical protein